MAESRVINKSGTGLHYWIEGPQDGPVVALLHGATLDHLSFDSQIAPLVEAGYQALAPDLRGHGKSVPLGQKLNLDILAGDLYSILDEVGAERAALVGHSFGGYVAQKFTRLYPERVRSLAVIGSTNLAKKSSPFFRLLYRIFPSILARMSLDTFRQRTLANLSESPAVKDYAFQAMQGISKEDFITITIAGIAALWLDSGFPAGYTVPKPFLLTHGAKDRANGAVFQRLSSAWAAKEPNCQYVVVPEAGHTAHMDNPAAFNAILIDFLNRN